MPAIGFRNNFSRMRPVKDYVQAVVCKLAKDTVAAGRAEP